MPSPLLDKLVSDIKDAMKSGRKDDLTALRMLHAQIKDATVNQGKEPADADVATIVAKAIKQRQDAHAQFVAAGRTDLSTKEANEIELFRAYQPQQLSEAEITELVKAAVAESGATSKKEMGKVMALLMPKVKGKADGKLVNEIVQKSLGA